MPSTAPPPPASARRVGIGAMLVGVAVMSGIYAPQPLLAEIAREFERSAFEANLVVSMTTLGIALGVFPMAAISARVGRGRTIAVGLLGSAVLTAATAGVDSWTALVVIRTLAGVASSAVLVSAVVWAGESVPRGSARRAAALYVAGTTGGGMLGRLVAGIVADVWGWRIGVAAVDIAVIGGAVAGLWLVRRYAVAGGRVVGPRSAAAPRGRGDRMLRLRAYALGFLGTSVFVGLFNAIAFRVTEPPFSLGLAVTSMLFLTYGAGTVSSMRTGVLLDRLGLRGTIVAGLAAMAGGIGLTFVDHLVPLVAGLLALAAGFFVVHAACSATAPAGAPKPTTASAWYTLFYYSGSSIGALLLGAAWDHAAWTGVGLCALALVTVALLVALTIRRPRTRSIPTLDQGEPS